MIDPLLKFAKGKGGEGVKFARGYSMRGEFNSRRRSGLYQGKKNGFVGPYFEVVGLARTDDRNEFSLILLFKADDGRLRLELFPCSAAYDARAAKARLAQIGFRLSAADTHTLIALSQVRSDNIFDLVRKPGWIADLSAYVLPSGRVIAAPKRSGLPIFFHGGL